MKKLRNKSVQKTKQYLRRKARTNVLVAAQSDRPRLVVSRSNKHIFAQIILDGKVVAAASDLKETKGTKSEKAYKVGEELAKKAASNKLQEVAFDRNGYLYHGRIKQLAEGARSGGLVF